MEDDERPKSGGALEPPWINTGTDLGRVLALSDGIFAFAMTLLVIELVLPTTAQGGALGAYLHSSAFLQSFYAYVLTFFVIAAWWQMHHLIFGYIRRYNRTLLQLNVLFLIFVAILPFATQVLNAEGSTPTGAVFFALSQVAAGGTLALIWTYASGGGRLIPRHIPEEWVTYLRRGILIAPLIFALSVPVAFVSTELAEGLWVATFVVGFLRRHRAKGSKNQA